MPSATCPCRQTFAKPNCQNLLRILFPLYPRNSWEKEFWGKWSWNQRVSCWQEVVWARGCGFHTVFYFRLKKSSQYWDTLLSYYRLICIFKHKLLVKQQLKKKTLLSTLYILMEQSLMCDMKADSFPVSLTHSNGLSSCSFSTPLNDLLQWRWVLCVQQCHLLAQFLWERDLAECH